MTANREETWVPIDDFEHAQTEANGISIHTVSTGEERHLPDVTARRVVSAEQ